jgi:hypothetical protein
MSADSISSPADTARTVVLAAANPSDTALSIALSAALGGGHEQWDQAQRLAFVGELKVEHRVFLLTHYLSRKQAPYLYDAVRGNLSDAEITEILNEHAWRWEPAPRDTRWDPRSAPPPPPVEPVSVEDLAGLVHEAMARPGETMTTLQHSLRATAEWEKQDVIELRKLLVPTEVAYAAYVLNSMLGGIADSIERSELEATRRLLLADIGEEQAAELISKKLFEWRCGPHHVTD